MSKIIQRIKCLLGRYEPMEWDQSSVGLDIETMKPVMNRTSCLYSIKFADARVQVDFTCCRHCLKISWTTTRI